MSEKDNTRVAEQYMEALNEYDLARVSGYLHEDFQFQDPATPEPLDETTFQAYMQGLWASYPDMTFEITQTIAQGDYVVVNYICTGTNSGPMTTPTGGTAPATGRTFTLPASSTLEFKDGKIVREQGYLDLMTLLAQLGLLPGA